MLESSPCLPDPLVTLRGQPVRTPLEWFTHRRPELKDLFEHTMYGYAPPAPERVRVRTLFEQPRAFGGKATLKEVEIRFGPRRVLPVRLLMAVPNKRSAPAPVILGLNFFGNHTLVDSSKVALPDVWVPARGPGVKNNRATASGRGTCAMRFPMAYAISRGYAVATFYHGDIDPDRPDFTDGIHRHYFRPGQKEPALHDWGTIAAWAWGLSRAVDTLLKDRTIDGKRIAVVGHSRNGKAALLAGAFDDRIALTMSHQAGCGGSAPSRGTVGESVKQINTMFPHWFNDEFPKFNDCVDRLPFDQHCLVALCAPKPVLFTNGLEDTWANPAGQFDVLAEADKVYRFLGVDGLAGKRMPPVGTLASGRLGYHIRKGKHSMGKQDWKVFLDYADTWL